MVNNNVQKSADLVGLDYIKLTSPCGETIRISNIDLADIKFSAHGQILVKKMDGTVMFCHNYAYEIVGSGEKFESAAEDICRMQR